MTEPELISSYDEFFTRSKGGAIWGRVYFRIGDDSYFPEKGWTDLAAAFLSGWLSALLNVSKGTSLQETAHFFDGPFTASISVVGDGAAELFFFRGGRLECSAKGQIRKLWENARAVSEEFLTKCLQNGWSNADTETIAELLREGSRSVH